MADKSATYDVTFNDGEIHIAGTGAFVNQCVQVLQAVVQQRQSAALESDGITLQLKAVAKKPDQQAGQPNQ